MVQSSHPRTTSSTVASSHEKPVDVPIDTTMTTDQPHLQRRLQGVIRQDKSRDYQTRYKSSSSRHL
eukprot:3944606-Prorocentrum_lima.AAC.1